MLVFVYGTLRAKQPNHSRCLAEAKLVCSHCVLRDFAMVSMGPFPAAYRKQGSTIVGEIYEIDKPILDRLDRLEGYPSFYRRAKVTNPFGIMWIYYRLVEDCKRYPVIPSGDWLNRS